MRSVIVIWVTRSPNPKSYARVFVRACVGVSVGASLLLLGDVADAAHVRVRGSAKLTAEVQRGSPMTIVGLLVDDFGAPIAGERVLVSMTPDRDPENQLAKQAARSAQGCAGSEIVPLDIDAMVRKTDEAGRFCVKIALPLDSYRLRVSWAGEKFVDGVKLDDLVDLTRAPLRLAFDPEIHVVSLDAKNVDLEAIATTEDDGTLHAATGRVVTLSTEAGAEIAHDATNMSGRVRFSIPTAKLGAPGRGELRLAFAGDIATSFAETRVPIERQAHVRLALVEPVAQGSTEDGVTAFIDLTTPQGAPVPEGSVEATLGDVVVGAAPVVQGRARFVLTFADHGTGPSDVRVRYVPVSPYYVAESALVVRVPASSASPWRRLPLVVLALLVLALFVLGRMRRPTLTIKEPVKRAAESLGLPRMDVVRFVPHAHVGWIGEIVDAHEGTPVAGARVTLERPGFQGRSTIASGTADEAGKFAIPFVDTAPGDELVVAGALHSDLRKPVPSEGELRIALVLRKRAILASLIAWAKMRGGAYDGKPEPTPGLVRRLSTNDYRTARWADAVEKGAFDAVTIDRRAEEEIEALRPDAPPSPLGQAAGPAVIIKDDSPGQTSGR